MGSIDDSELRAFATELETAGSAAQAKVHGVVAKGALNIKNQLTREMRASKHFKGVARSISYDMREGGAFGGGFVEAEIGPESGPGSGGNLANIAYFGGSGWGGKRSGGTVPDPQSALDAEAPRFEKALLDLIGDV